MSTDAPRGCDLRALAWHQAATLLRLARKLTRRQMDDERRARAHALLETAARLTDAAG